MLGFSALGEFALGQSVADIYSDLSADAGAFVLTGRDAFTAYNRVAAGFAAGSFVLTGVAIGYGRILTAGPGAFVISGVTSKPDRRRLMITMLRGGDNGII